jgi:hypothetical protein
MTTHLDPALRTAPIQQPCRRLYSVSKATATVHPLTVPHTTGGFPLASMLECAGTMPELHDAADPGHAGHLQTG